MNKFLTWSAILFGAGKFPKAPGTAGSLVAVIFYYLLANYTGFLSLHFANFIFLGFILFITLYGVYASFIAEKTYGHDAGCIVIDEFAGQLLAFLWLPKISLLYALLGFILFRIFDISKPLIINKAQDLPHGWGIMMDDILAGLFAAVILNLLFWFHLL